MTETQKYFLIYIVCNLPVILFIAAKFFSKPGSLKDTLKWMTMPDIWSLVTGNFHRDQRAELKFSLFLITVILTLSAEWWLLSSIIELFKK